MNQTLHTVTAVRSGTLPGGLDCYIGDDGERYLSQRGILRGIRFDKDSEGLTSGPEKGDLGRYLARLPNASDTLTSGPEVEIRIPIEGGGFRLALGRPARFLVAMCSAYIEAHAAGTLHRTQIPIAHRCAALLAAFAQKGIEAMVDEACGALVRVPGASAAALSLADVEALVDRKLREAMISGIVSYDPEAHRRLAALDTSIQLLSRRTRDQQATLDAHAATLQGAPAFLGVCDAVSKLKTRVEALSARERIRAAIEDSEAEEGDGEWDDEDHDLEAERQARAAQEARDDAQMSACGRDVYATAQRCKMPTAMLRTLRVLASSCDETGRVQKSMSAILDHGHMAELTARQSLARLVEGGWIVVLEKQRAQYPKVYGLRIPDVFGGRNNAPGGNA